jgi:hypothetical protein
MNKDYVDALAQGITFRAPDEPIQNPDIGEAVWDSNSNSLLVWDGSQWQTVATSPGVSLTLGDYVFLEDELYKITGFDELAVKLRHVLTGTPKNTTEQLSKAMPDEIVKWRKANGHA